jgi:hypothetical protein
MDKQAKVDEQITHVEVELGRVLDIIIHNLNSKGIAEEGQELLELGGANTIGTVQNNRRQLGLSLDQDLVSSGQLFVISLHSGLAVSLGGTGSVKAAGKVMQLRSGEDAIVGRMSIQDLESINQGSNQGFTTGAGIASIDNIGGVGEVNLQGADHDVDIVQNLLVCLCVREGGSMSLPGTLEHLSHGINQFDSIVLTL